MICGCCKPLLAAVLSWLSFAAAVLATRHSDTEIPKLQQCVAGSNTSLKCGIKEYHAEYMNASDVQWYFKPCGEGNNRTSCNNREALDNVHWRLLSCDNKPCRVMLPIRNASEADSGLYRCAIHPYRIDNQTQLDIQLVRTFQLDVIRSYLDESAATPELLDNLPANTTALLDTQVALQCRVYSKVQPSIKWFRQINLNKRLEEHNFNQNKSIRYLENFYELLPSSGEKPVSNDIYLSKLILYNVSERDIGIYVCVGINYRGVSTADAYVNVVYPNGATVEAGSSVTDLMVLFLIPIPLVLVPLFLWIVFNTFRRSNASEEKSLMDLGTNVFEQRKPTERASQSKAPKTYRSKSNRSFDSDTYTYTTIKVS